MKYSRFFSLSDLLFLFSKKGKNLTETMIIMKERFLFNTEILQLLFFIFLVPNFQTSVLNTKF
jgi:hypothetical protein